MSHELPSPPDHLSDDAAALWRWCVEAFDSDAATLRLLQHACESMDAAETHRQILEQQGQTITDRFEQVREHPSAKSQRDFMARYQSSIKSLGLLDSPPSEHTAGRPPAVIARVRAGGLACHG